MNNASSSIGQMKQVAEASKPPQQPAGPDVPGTSTTAPSYRIFSTPNANPLEKHGIAAGVQNNGGNQYGSTSNRGLGGSQNLLGSKPDGCQNGGNSGQEGFGIFSRLSSSMTSKEIFKPK
ncbi:hypothetical protein SLA2020_169400 [Shorea laevis]